jgi:hypothetical protein
MSDTINPAAPEHLPMFITAPGQSDWLFGAMVVVVLIAIIMIGVFYFRLHALPEHLAHRTTKIQYEIVAVLGLLSLFTHNNVYWVAALLLALVQLPDFTSPLTSIAESLAKMAGSERRLPGTESMPSAPSMSSGPAGHTPQVAGEAKDSDHV